MEDLKSEITGGCLCGDLRYVSKAAPVRGIYCHCKMCQKNYGGLFQATLQFSRSKFEFVRGVPTFYHSSEIGRRGFCGKCGSPLMFTYESNPDVWVLIGSLDHPEDWPLTRGASWGEVVHTHPDAKIPWHDIDDGLRQMFGTPFQDQAKKILDEGTKNRGGEVL